MPQVLADNPQLQALRSAMVKRDQQRPCYPKVRFQTAAEADGALAAMQAKGKAGAADRPLGRYHCRFCEGFHLGRGRTAPVPTPDAVNMDGNTGVVSFEEAPIGQHPPDRRQRRMRMRGGVLTEIPPKRRVYAKVAVAGFVTALDAQGHPAAITRTPDAPERALPAAPAEPVPSAQQEIAIWACVRCGAFGSWPSASGRHEQGGCGGAILPIVARAADPGDTDLTRS